jgi:hypothetical protein
LRNSPEAGPQRDSEFQRLGGGVRSHPVGHLGIIWHEPYDSYTHSRVRQVTRFLVSRLNQSVAGLVVPVATDLLCAAQYVSPDRDTASQYFMGFCEIIWQHGVQSFCARRLGVPGSGRVSAYSNARCLIAEFYVDGVFSTLGEVFDRGLTVLTPGLYRPDHPIRRDRGAGHDINRGRPSLSAPAQNRTYGIPARLPPRVFGAEALRWLGIGYPGAGEPAFSQLVHQPPRRAVLLVAPAQGASPKFDTCPTLIVAHHPPAG